MKFWVICVYQSASKVHRELKMRVQTKAQPLWILRLTFLTQMLPLKLLNKVGVNLGLKKLTLESTGTFQG